MNAEPDTPSGSAGAPLACPRCGAADVLGFPAAAESGVSAASIIGLATSLDTAEGRSLLPLLQNPPQRRNPNAGLLAAGMGWIASAFLFKASRAHSDVSLIVRAAAALVPGLLGTLAAILAWRANSRWNRVEFVRLRKIWEKSSLCRRCGCAWTAGDISRRDG